MQDAGTGSGAVHLELLGQDAASRIVVTAPLPRRLRARELAAMGGRRHRSSFRGCNKGAEDRRRHRRAWSWRLGRSEPGAARVGSGTLQRVSGRRRWRSSAIPDGEFCGQHAAQLLPNGHLLLYDNGVHCLVDPVRAAMGIASPDVFSRAVEYALDHVDNGEAVFVRDHSLHNAYDRAGQCLRSHRAAGGRGLADELGPRHMGRRPRHTPAAMTTRPPRWIPTPVEEKFSLISVGCPCPM